MAVEAQSVRPATRVARELQRESRGTRFQPRATYRLQFNAQFTFAAARRAAPYLAKLGVDTIYASPYLKSRPGSTHGYDIVDHNQLDPEIGSPDEYERLAGELDQLKMHQVLDVVPNHVGIGPGGSVWWSDVLENGPSSPRAPFFDIDWHPLPSDMTLDNRLLIPVLGGPYGDVLERQELKLAYEDGAFWLVYYDNRLPVSPSSYDTILEPALAALLEKHGEDEHAQEFQSIITAIQHLPPTETTDPGAIQERAREKEVIKRRIARLCDECPDARAAIARAVDETNGRSGDPTSFDRLDALINRQAYRLAFWRVASEEINYRRFFDVNDLAAIRMERPEVFEEAHRLVFELIRQGRISGLRIDHVDGLWSPEDYLRRLQLAYLRHVRGIAQIGGADEAATAEGAAGANPDPLADPALAADLERLDRPPLYVVVEKILGRGEDLPERWPIDGTTGYDFLASVNGIFVDRASRKSLDDTYRGFVGQDMVYREIVNSRKKMIMLVSLASEVNALSHELKRLANRSRWHRDLTLNNLTFALREVIAALPVYRTYIDDSCSTVSERDRAAIERAIAEARRRNPRTAREVFDYLRDCLLLQNQDRLGPEERELLCHFVMKFQQTTGPVMAKGVEDTTFYVYNRLISLNEVGGDPGELGTTLDAFHAENVHRQQRWPTTLLATATHDTKRGEDVRARINVLSEVPREWRTAANRWARWNRAKKTTVGEAIWPDSNAEYFLYQTLIGAWPLEPLDDATRPAFVQRIQDYMHKAGNEAKAYTSWVNPNADYESAMRHFVDGILDPKRSSRFLADFGQFQEITAFYGMVNSLAQLLLKCAGPGVPDFYQGTELWSLTLVDPDNRRPVDFDARLRLLGRLQKQFGDSRASNGRSVVDGAPALLDHWQDGGVKMYVTWRALEARGRDPDLYLDGAYLPLTALEKGEHVVAFQRHLGNRSALVIVPRLAARLTSAKKILPIGEAVWGESQLALAEGAPGDRFRDVLTGETVTVGATNGQPRIRVADALATFPIALLEQIRR